MPKKERKFYATWQCEHCGNDGETSVYPVGGLSVMVILDDHAEKSPGCTKQELIIETIEITDG